MRYLLFLLLIPPCFSQTFPISAPLLDLSGSTQVVPFPFGTTLPTTGCVPNSFFNKLGSSPGLYINSATGSCSWTIVTGGGGGGVTVTCGVGTTCINTTGNTQVITSPEVPLNSNLQGGLSPIICIDSSSSTTAYTPACGQPLPSYATKQTFTTFFANSNTTSTPTGNYDTLGAKTYTCGDGSPLPPLSLKVGYPYISSFDGTNVRLAGTCRPVPIGIIFDGGGSALSTGNPTFIPATASCTIMSWGLTVYPSGTATVGVWKVAAGTAIPTSGNSITGSGTPAISTGTALVLQPPTGWTSTQVTRGDIFGFNLNAVAGGATQVTINLECNQ